VARVAGNFENADILGSMEFATKISGAKLILVLGHEDCGAIKAAIDQAKLGNITAMLENIRPAVEALSSYKGEQTSANPEFVHLVAAKNVRLSMRDIRERSSILKGMEEQGQIKIIGALYDMNSGAVEFLDCSWPLIRSSQAGLGTTGAATRFLLMRPLTLASRPTSPCVRAGRTPSELPARREEQLWPGDTRVR